MIAEVAQQNRFPTVVAEAGMGFHSKPSLLKAQFLVRLSPETRVNKESSLSVKPHFPGKKSRVRCYAPCSPWHEVVLGHGPASETTYLGAVNVLQCAKKRVDLSKHLTTVGLILGLTLTFFIFDSVMFSVIHHFYFGNSLSVKETKELQRYDDEDIPKRTPKTIYKRLLSLALNESQFHTQHSSPGLWDEPYKQASLWKPCANKREEISQDAVKSTRGEKQNGFILVSANGGLNQQRVAVCNAVAVASLLNATLVIPKFLYSSVWKDVSQFGDIYQEEYFINFLKDDLNIVRELPHRLQSPGIEAIGSQITDADLGKESEPIHFIEKVLPLLLRNGVVHFLGFGNRLGFDPLPSHLQRLRCKCNFHALKFAPKIQETGSLLVQRIKEHNKRASELDLQLLGDHTPNGHLEESSSSKRPSRYLALHLRFEIDMVAYSLCSFGGGEDETRELQAYREIHFPLLVHRMAQNSSAISPEDRRKSGKCPLTPEEAALVLAAAGFGPGTYVYLAGSRIYGGKSRMLPLMRLFPNLVTKEDLLTEEQLAPFKNFSSQMAALDFIACAAADVFAMTDTGSQLSSLVSGFRAYHGGGAAPILRPDKKALAEILSQSGGAMGWSSFSERVKRMIHLGQRPHVRRRGRSIYREPRSPGCMCQGPDRS